ncbi:zinc-binding protein A33-like isoform X2 [Leucoraja erinacea]|uniref:zinc-binding protein A33-like isoform X2 n=1 Tax=Leucoraja erinaceus TaxID=7782 RepID=UPI0024590601|nr:zinc-binding protein A33-like isoform X2 [Leucoraja erinacea]
MASGHSTLSLEDELNCPLCLELYSDPVILDCGHDFCRECIVKKWEDEAEAQCPECGQTFPEKTFKANRALGKLVKKSRNISLNLKVKGNRPYCLDHEEELKLFCETDKKLICVMCLDRRDGRSHKAHNFMLINEAVEIYKEKMKGNHTSFKQKKNYFQEFEEKQEEKISEIKEQSNRLQNHITNEFTKMRDILDEKQKGLFNDLMSQESDVLLKMEMNLRRIQDNLSLTQQMLQNVEKRLEYQDVYMLLKEPPPDEKSEEEFHPTITEGNLPLAAFQGPVQYTVWKQVINVISPVPASLTLNPSTAHPRLLLSDDLTVVSYGDVKQDVPDNSERFDTCVCVLGSEAYVTGQHYWEVQVGGKTEWDVGVVKESISRKGHTTATPDAGYWIVWLRNGNEYKATTVPRTRLNVASKPKAIGVFLDYEGGQVSFYNVDNMSHLYSFTDSFSERLFPYFSPGINDDGENSEPLKVLPVGCQEN